MSKERLAEYFTVRLTPKDIKAIAVLAHFEDRSKCNMVRQLIREALAREDKK